MGGETLEAALNAAAKHARFIVSLVTTIFIYAHSRLTGMWDDRWLWDPRQTNSGQSSFMLQIERDSKVLNVIELDQHDSKGDLDQWLRHHHSRSKVFEDFRTGSARSDRIERVDIQGGCHKGIGEC